MISHKNELKSEEVKQKIINSGESIYIGDGHVDSIIQLVKAGFSTTEALLIVLIQAVRTLDKDE